MSKKINTVEKAVAWAEKQAEKNKPLDPYPDPTKPAEASMTHEVSEHPPAVFTNKVGRPTLYCGEKTCDAVKMLASKGLIDVEIAQALLIAESTFHLWKTEHPELIESIKEGKKLIDEQVQKSLLGRAMGCIVKETKAFCYEGDIITEEIDKHIAPDVAAQIFWLKNRKPKEWRDKHDIDLTVPFNINMEEKDVNTL
jgi:hypothetical protein